MDPAAPNFVPEAHREHTVVVLNPAATEYVLHVDGRYTALSPDQAGQEHHHIEQWIPTNTTYPNLSLPIPSSDLYQDMYHPPHPNLHPFLQPAKSPTHNSTTVLAPLNDHSIHSDTLLSHNHINQSHNLPFTHWQSQYLPLTDTLLSHICPSDLNDMPCPWDELQGGCAYLRLCAIKRKYPHPHLGVLPECVEEEKDTCPYLHDVQPTCRSLCDQLNMAPERQFRAFQTCPVIASQTERNLGDPMSFCPAGHDLESSRVRAIWAYWEHRVCAQRCGARHVIGKDRWGVSVRRPRPPKRQTLGGTSNVREWDGSVVGWTWHGDVVRLTGMVGRDFLGDD